MRVTRQAPITPNYLTIHALPMAELDVIHTFPHWGNGPHAATTIPCTKLSRVVGTLDAQLGKLGDPPESYSKNVTDTILKRHGHERWAKSDPDMIVTSLETFIQGLTQQLGINLEPRHNMDIDAERDTYGAEDASGANDGYDDDDIDQLFENDVDGDDDNVDSGIVYNSQQAECTFVLDPKDATSAVQRTRRTPIVDEFLKAYPEASRGKGEQYVSRFVQWLGEKFQIV